MNKQMMSRTDLINKIVKMIKGMQAHRIEPSTVENIRVLMDNKIISRMKKDSYLRNKFMEMFVASDLEVNDFATKCLIKALDGYFKHTIEDEAKGQLANALCLSKFGDTNEEVDTIILKIAPFDWVRPQSHSMSAAA